MLCRVTLVPSATRHNIHFPGCFFLVNFVILGKKEFHNTQIIVLYLKIFTTKLYAF